MSRFSSWKSILFFTLLFGLLHSNSAPAQEPAAQANAVELKVVKTFRIGGEGRWDYPLVDPATHRLFITRAGRVTVVDSQQGTPLGEIRDLRGAHGVALVPQHNLGFATSGRDNVVEAFDLTNYKTLNRIPAGTNPDAILYDPASQKIFAFCGRSGDATIIDPANLDQNPISFPIGEKLESGVADGLGHIYVNDENKSEIVAIDSKQPKVLAHWPLDPAKSPTGLAIDVEHHRLYAGCANKKMAVVDSESGKLLATVDIGAGVDGVAFDPQIGAISANGRDGTISVVRESSPGQFTVVQTLPTVATARTITGDPTAHQFFLPAMLPGENGTGDLFGVAVVGLANEKSAP